jgi:hypothetical protein
MLCITMLNYTEFGVSRYHRTIRKSKARRRQDVVKPDSQEFIAMS